MFKCILSCFVVLVQQVKQVLALLERKVEPLCQNLPASVLVGNDKAVERFGSELVQQLSCAKLEVEMWRVETESPVVEDLVNFLFWVDDTDCRMSELRVKLVARRAGVDFNVRVVAQLAIIACICQNCDETQCRKNEAFQKLVTKDSPSLRQQLGILERSFSETLKKWAADPRYKESLVTTAPAIRQCAMQMHDLRLDICK